MTDKILIYLADDHEMIRIGLTNILSDYPDLEVLATFERGCDLISRYQRERADVILLDFRMPGRNGYKVLADLISIDPSARVIMLSAFEEEENIWCTVSAGAAGYLSKSSSSSEIHDAIVAVAQGDQYFPPAIQQKIEIREGRMNLTAREKDVLQLMAIGMSNKMIMEHLTLSMPTVKTHVSNILIKLEANDRTHAVAKAIRRGLIQLGV